MKFNQETYQLLEEKYDLFNRKSFITSNPISIPPLFKEKEYIEITGFLSADIAWEQRQFV